MLVTRILGMSPQAPEKHVPEAAPPARQRAGLRAHSADPLTGSVLTRRPFPGNTTVPWLHVHSGAPAIPWRVGEYHSQRWTHSLLAEDLYFIG